ncbi:MAG: phosphatidate cytidylyltransferase, partial [Ruminococcus sp.]|nr:phosphatidate cytidylyltransferase [Ruminococcus sp.]
MLTRIISGAVGVVIMAVVLYFHNTIVLPIAVALMIAVMLYELLRAVKMHRCVPVLIASEICGISMPFIYNMF